MHRFFVSPEHSRETLLPLSVREAHHACHVLRLKEGERVVALDGAGNELLCQIESIRKNKVHLRVLKRHIVPPLPYQLILVQAITKPKSMENIIQKAVELGVHAIVPIQAERTVSHLDPGSSENKLEKWKWIATDAIKQCGSAWLPSIHPPLKPAAYLALGEKFDLTLIATLQGDARHPRVHLDDYAREKGRKPKRVAVWVGPEGDFTPAEIHAIRAAGALPITLGPVVLRSETAAIYCLSVLNYELNAP